ncbi:hypothetical protein MHU86_21518 [Fragilaria crotonensis]|nr:hypothetical protein MHU86_21518 [Fragilaria crotonensis]
MGNAPSSSEEETAAGKAKKLVEEVQSSIKTSIRNFDESQSANFLDSICGPIFDDDPMKRNRSYAYSEELSDEDSRTVSDGDNSTMESSRRGTSSNRKGISTESGSVFSQSDYESEATSRGATPRKFTDSFESEEDSYLHRKNKEIEKVNTTSSRAPSSVMSKPLASAFAKRCYFTKAGIGKTTQHYEGLTLTGNVVLMLATAMKLKGCPTICDEDLRRVEQTYPNQFSRLPDELLLSSGWRRISKYCHFSNKPIPDGVPFFHSKKRVHPQGGYYFLLAAAVGMIRPSDVEPLTRDTLVLLETDYPTQADAAPSSLVHDPTEWTLVDKFCFFSGGPINTEEDVYYQADFDGNPIHMLAFLSPSLTPEELYKLTQDNTDEPGLKSVAAVEDVESVYDLTERDFDDLKLYHLGPCRALPPYILQPQAWIKVLPPHFLAAKHRALMRAQRWEDIHGPSMSMTSSAVLSNQDYNYGTLPMNPLTVQVAPPVLSPAAAGLPLGTPQSPGMVSPGMIPASAAFYGSQGTPIVEASSPRSNQFSSPKATNQNGAGYYHATPPSPPKPREMVSSPDDTEQSTSVDDGSFQREVEEEGAFVDKTLPIDEAMALRSKKQKAPPPPSQRGPISPPGYRPSDLQGANAKMDPPDDEPPSLSRDDIPDDEDYQPSPTSYYTSPSQTVEASSPASYYPSGGEFSPEQNPEGSEYHSREDEYYDSPEHLGNNPYHPPPPGGEYYHQDEMNLSPESMHRPEVYHRDPHYQSQPHPHYHHEEPHPDYGHHGGLHPDYHDVPHGQYYGESRPSYDDADPPAYHDPAHTGAYHGPDHDGFHGESVSPEMYHGQGAPEYYRSPEADDYNNTENEPPMDRYALASSPTTMPSSPKSEVTRSTGGSDHSQSSAMRTAQDLLRRNRAKRMEADRKKQLGQENLPEDEPSVGNEFSESGSEMTSVISGSSVWTDTSGANDRSSRRALILQMAKARMKQSKSHVEDKTNVPIVEESFDENPRFEKTEAANSEDVEEELELD